MRRLIMIGLLAAALCAGGSGAKAANLLGNGDFETPVVPTGSFTRFTNGQAIGAWTVTGATGNVDLISGTFSTDGFFFLPGPGGNGSTSPAAATPQRECARPWRPFPAASMS